MQHNGPFYSLTPLTECLSSNPLLQASSWTDWSAVVWLSCFVGSLFVGIDFGLTVGVAVSLLQQAVLWAHSHWHPSSMPSDVEQQEPLLQSNSI